MNLNNVQKKDAYDEQMLIMGINESIEKKVNKTIESSKSTNLNESTAYVDPQITAIKDLMRRIS